MSGTCWISHSLAAKNKECSSGNTGKKMHEQGISQSTGLLQRMEQLDGLRAIAVLLVFYTHFTPWVYQFNMPWGDSGVDLFFVLSGFLITSILLKCRRFIEDDGQ